MPRKKIQPCEREKIEQMKFIKKRLIEVSFKVDGHIYEQKPISKTQAQLFLDEISRYDSQCSGDARYIQVIEKLKKFMRIIISNDEDITKGNDESCQQNINEETIENNLPDTTPSPQVFTNEQNYLPANNINEDVSTVNNLNKDSNLNDHGDQNLIISLKDNVNMDSVVTSPSLIEDHQKMQENSFEKTKTCNVPHVADDRIEEIINVVSNNNKTDLNSNCILQIKKKVVNNNGDDHIVNNEKSSLVPVQTDQFNFKQPICTSMQHNGQGKLNKIVSSSKVSNLNGNQKMKNINKKKINFKECENEKIKSQVSKKENRKKNANPKIKKSEKKNTDKEKNKKASQTSRKLKNKKTEIDSEKKVKRTRGTKKTKNTQNITEPIKVVENKENDLSWFDTIKFIREVDSQEYFTTEQEFDQSFWEI